MASESQRVKVITFASEADRKVKQDELTVDGWVIEHFLPAPQPTQVEGQPKQYAMTLIMKKVILD